MQAANPGPVHFFNHALNRVRRRRKRFDEEPGVRERHLWAGIRRRGWLVFSPDTKKKPRLRRSLGFNNKENDFGVLAMVLGMTVARVNKQGLCQMVKNKIFFII